MVFKASPAGKAANMGQQMNINFSPGMEENFLFVRETMYEKGSLSANGSSTYQSRVVKHAIEDWKHAIEDGKRLPADEMAAIFEAYQLDARNSEPATKNPKNLYLNQTWELIQSVIGPHLLTYPAMNLTYIHARGGAFNRTLVIGMALERLVRQLKAEGSVVNPLALTTTEKGRVNKLTDTDVRQIKLRLQAISENRNLRVEPSDSVNKIAVDFAVNPATILAIRTGRTWSQVTLDDE